MTLRGRRAAIMALCAVFAGFGGVRATAGELSTYDVESLKITVDTEWVERGAPGYVPIRIEIANLGEARQLEIVGGGHRVGQGGFGNWDLRQRINLARGDRQRLTIPVPVDADSEYLTLALREGWHTIARFGPVTFRRTSGHSTEAQVLVVATSGGLESFARSGGGRSGSRSSKPVFTIEPNRLPANWLGYTSVRWIAIGPREWDQLDEAQRQALRTWVACGGSLWILDDDDGKLQRAFQVQETPLTYPNLRRYHSFLGRIASTSSANIALGSGSAFMDDGYSLPLRDHWQPSPGARGFLLPIAGVGIVPKQAYAAILVLFALLIGPANYFVLWRTRRQVLLVLTTPVIAAAFIALLVLYSMFHDGFAVRGRAESITVLDQTTKQAATGASVSLYAAGMAPAGGLRFSRDTAVIPMQDPKRKTVSSRAVDLTDNQRLAGGFIQARTPCNFEQRCFRVARERLTFTREGGRVTVSNGLGATVSALVYRDDDLYFSTDTPLRAGESRSLSGSKSPRSLREVAKKAPHLRERHDTLDETSPDPRVYVALLERSPFWEPGVPALEESDSFHLVVGYVGRTP